MYGCRYCKMNKNYEEYCVLTGELTNGAALCDFEFDLYCPHYKAAQEAEKATQNEEARGKAHADKHIRRGRRKAV